MSSASSDFSSASDFSADTPAYSVDPPFFHLRELSVDLTNPHQVGVAADLIRTALNYLTLSRITAGGEAPVGDPYAHTAPGTYTDDPFESGYDVGRAANLPMEVVDRINMFGWGWEALDLWDLIAEGDDAYAVPESPYDEVIEPFAHDLWNEGFDSGVTRQAESRAGESRDA